MRRSIASIVRNDCGATAVTVALTFTVIVLFSVVVTDAGFLFAVRRQAQAAADAASLAGCQTLIDTDSAAAAEAAAQDYMTKNAVRPAEGLGIETIEVGADYVQVTVLKQSPLFFARLLGLFDTPVRASARAQAEAIGGSRVLVPWGLPIIVAERAEAQLVDSSGSSVGPPLDLAKSGNFEFSGLMTAPGSVGSYGVQVRIFNKFGVFETLLDGPKVASAGAVVVGSPFEYVRLSESFLTNETPELPVILTVKTTADLAANESVKVNLGSGGSGQDIKLNATGQPREYAVSLGASRISSGHEMFRQIPLDVYVDRPGGGNVAKPGQGVVDAFINLRRSTHVIEDVDVGVSGNSIAAPGQSVPVKVSVHDYDYHSFDGTIYSLRQDATGGETGNFGEVNYDSITHNPGDPTNPPGLDLGSGNQYAPWTAYGYLGGVHIGDVIKLSPGMSGQNTQKALDVRFLGINSGSLKGNGTVVPSDQWVVHVPIVQRTADKDSATGAYYVEVVDFASFLVTAYGQKGQTEVEKGHTTGHFIEYTGPPHGWLPGGSGAKAPRLVVPQ